MQETTPMKHLYRSNTDKVFAGICGGLGEYWNIDPVIFRFLWVLLTVFTGFVPGIIAYVLVIFIVPTKPAESANLHQ